ncbi:hypothetical protein [Pelagibacterium lentulum]|uniref:Uncharacterized protein n=1 Tax=Pelagibacterium lentulum TaxID=2029865 RepID=A0A916RPG1_9HYPH|nr:hypothetical protein [Pelagibacterium lentulum]GGA63735.1 hypothetical protein GCM10011499_37630 [Pelagibacterium lentulum]
MTRPLPIRANIHPMAARAKFDPSGAHELEIDLGMSGIMDLTAEQARRVKAAIEAFELESMRVDGHSNLTNRVVRTLGEF